MRKLSLRDRFKSRFGVGLKVASTVVFFEIILIVAYTILTQLFVDGGDLLSRLLRIEHQNAVLVILIASLVLAGYLTFLVIVRIFSPVADLIRGTEEIINGNLDLELKTDTGDELEVLAERFNAMTKALKEERDSLENKVKERTKALEDAQTKELEKQKEIMHLKDEFLFVAAHELRTPVTSIRWSLESIMDMKRIPKEAKEFMRDAMNSGKNLELLVGELLNMARLDAKGIAFKQEKVDVKEVVHTVVKEMSSLGEERKIKIIEEAPEEEILSMADSRRLREVLVNLVGNALKYNKDEGKIWVRVRMSQGFVEIEVEDNGPGIRKEDQKHIFEKFWRSKDVEGVEGSGLGLFITKRLVDGMNGTIDFSSEVGKGAKFTVSLQPVE